MSLDGARLRYEDENGRTVVLAAKGRTFQVGSYYTCDLILEGPEEERLICEINCDAFGRVIIYNKSSEDPIHLNDAAIHAAGKRPLLHGGKITIRDKVYTWEFPKSSEVEDAPCTPERLLPNEQASNSCPSLKQSHRLQAEKRLTVHNFHYSINSDDEGNTSIESRDQSETHLYEDCLNESIPPSTEKTPCESPKVNLLEATQNKENTATPPGSHQKLLKLCALSDVVITSFSPRETGVKIEKSFTCVRKPGYTTTSLAVSTPKSVYSTPKGSVLSELNEDSCSRDLMDFNTPSTSKKTKRESSMFLIDLTTPSKLRQTPKQTPAFKHIPKQTPISVDSTDESDASPFVIDITNSDTPSSPSPSQRYKTPQRQAAITGVTPKRTPQSLIKRALLTSTKKQIDAKQPDKTTPIATPKRPSLLEARRQCLTTPRRLPFHPQRRTPVQARGNPPKTSPRNRISLMESPRQNKVSQLRNAFAAAKRSPGVDKSNKLVAKARRSLNSPKGGSPRPGSSKPSSPCSRKPIDRSQINSSTPENPDDSKNELSRTFTIMDDSQGKNQSGAVLAIEAVTALITEEVDHVSDVSFQLSSLIEKGFPSVSSKEPTPIQDPVEIIGTENDANGKLKSSQQNVSPKPDWVIIEENERELKSIVKNELESGTKQEGCKQKDCDLQDEEKIVTSAIPIDRELEDAVVEDNICEEVHANIPQQTQNANSEKIIEENICEELPSENRSTGNSNSIEETSQKKDEQTTNTPMVRRSLRRLSVEQRAAATTPRRSTRGSSMEARSKVLPEKDNKRSRRASCSAMDSQDVVTPRRKRRFTQEMATPTRQSMRILKTPKGALQVDESVGDMGVILEEVGPEDDNKSADADDENYGNELPVDDIDKVDYHGLRNLLKTPKSCSTPRFKGLREMMQTPKIPASPILGHMAELLETSVGRTPFHERRSTAVARMEHGKPLENVLKTPSARNIMVPIEPASAVLKSREDSLAATTEYDLNMTNNTLHLDKIFDDVSESTGANMEDTETEINVTAISTTGVDPLGSSNRNETATSEALMSVGQTATTSASLKDPLTSTTYKATMQANPNPRGFADCGSRSFSPNPNEMSGIQLLDQTSDSMFSEALVVSGGESCEVTVDETSALGQTKPPTDNIEDRSDTDSNVGLTEPLVLSDDEDEEPKETDATPKKIDTAQEPSIVYKLEESVNLEENKTGNEHDAGTISEISLIEVDDTTIEGSTCDQNLEGDKLQEKKTLDIESADSENTEAPLDENIESEVVELSILESEVFPLETTADSSIHSTYVLNSSLEKTITDHDLKQEDCESTNDAQTTAITAEKSSTDLDRSVVKVSPSNNCEVNIDDPPMEISPSKELEAEKNFGVDHTDDETSKPSVERSEELSEESKTDKVSTAAEADKPVTEALPTQKDTPSPAESKQTFTESHSDELVQETNSNEVSIDGEVIQPAIETLPCVEQEQEPDVFIDAESNEHCIKSSPLNELSDTNQNDEVLSLVNTEQEVKPHPVKEVLKETKSDAPIQPVIETYLIEELQEEVKPDEAPTVSDSPVKAFIESKADDNTIKPIIETTPEREPPEEECPSVSENVEAAEKLSVESNPIDETSKPTIEVPDLSEIDQLIIEKSPVEQLPDETIQPIIETSPGDEDQIEACPEEVSSVSEMDNVVVESNPQTEELIPPDEIGICEPVDMCDTSIRKTMEEVSDIDRDKIQDHHSTQNLSLNSSSDVPCVSQAEESLNNSTAAFEIKHSEDVVHATTSIDADISERSKETEKMATVPNDVGYANQSSIERELANVISSDGDELELSTNSSKISQSCTHESPKTSLCVTSTSQDESAQIDELDEIDHVEEHVVLEVPSNEIMATDKESAEKFKEYIPDDALSVVEQTSLEQNALIHQSLTDQNKEVSIVVESEAVLAEKSEAVFAEESEAVVAEESEAVVAEESEAVVAEESKAVVVEEPETVVADESKECQVNKASKTEVIHLDASTIVELDTLNESRSVREAIDQSTEISMLEELSDVDKIREINTMDKKASTECTPKKHSNQEGNDDEVILLDASSLDESSKKEAEKCNQNQSENEVISLETSSIVEQCPPNEDSLIQDPVDDIIPDGILIQANDAKECVSEESSNQNGVENKIIQLDSSSIVQQSLSEDTVPEPANNTSIIAETSAKKEICHKILGLNTAPSSPHHFESQKSELQLNQMEDPPGDTTSASTIRQNPSPNGELLNVASAHDIEFPISKRDDKPNDVSDAMADAKEAPTEAEDAIMQESAILITSSQTDELDLHKSLSQTENISSEDVQSAEDGAEVEEVEIIVRPAEQQAQPGDPANSSSIESTAVAATFVMPHEDPAAVEFKSSITSSAALSATEPQVVVTIEESADVKKTSDGEDTTNNLQEKDNIPMEPDTIQEQEDGTHTAPVSEDISALPKTESTSAVGPDQEMLALKDDSGLMQPNAEDKPSEELIHSTSTDSKTKERPDVIDNEVEIPTSEPTIPPEQKEMSLLNQRPSDQEEKSPHEEESKPERRVTRKGSASADRALGVERPKRVTRKPSAEVLEIEDCASDAKEDSDLSIKSRGRARKPSSDVNVDKTEGITENRRGRIRTPSVEVPEATANVEPKENEEDLKSEEALQPILEEEPEPEVEERIESNKEHEIIIDKPKKRLRKASSKESDTLLDIEKINTDMDVVNEAGNTHSNNTEQGGGKEHIVLTAKSEVETDLEGERDGQDTNQKHTTKERPKRHWREATSNETDTASEKIENAEGHLEATNEDGMKINTELEPQVSMTVLPNSSNEGEKQKTEVIEDAELKPKRRVRKASAKETNTTSDRREKTEDILAAVIEVESSLSSKNKLRHSEPKGQQVPAPDATSNISKEEPDPDNVPNVSSENKVRMKSTEDISNVPDKRHKLESLHSIENQDDVSKETAKTRPERPKRRACKPSDDIVESNAPNDAHNPEAEKALAYVQDQSNLADQDIPKKRARKSAELKLANVEEHAKEHHVERPTRKVRKSSADIDHVTQDLLEKPKRRGKTPAEHETHPLGDEKQEPSVPVVEPAKKTRRNARKASAETVEAVSNSGEEHLEQIDEATEPVTESEPASSEPIPKEGEEPKTRRRGRKSTGETEEGSIKTTPAEEPSVPGIEPAKKTRRNARKASAETVEAVSNSGEDHLEQIDEATEPVTESEPASSEPIPKEGEEPKTRRRGRKSTGETEEGTIKNTPAEEPSVPVVEPAKKTRRNARKASAETVEAVSNSGEDHLEQIDEATEPVTELEPASSEPIPKEGEEPKTRRRGRKSTVEADEGTIKTTPAEEPSVPVVEPAKKTRRNARKASAETVEAVLNSGEEHLKQIDEATESVTESEPASSEPIPKEGEEPKTRRRGRKSTVEADEGTIKTTPAEEPSVPVVEPAKKTRRNARKASAETVEAVSNSGEEHLKQIAEATESVIESEPTSSVPIPKKGEEPKTRRRGRKSTVETDEGTIKPTPAEEPVALPSHSRKRGRKATEDEALTTEDLTEPKTKLRGRRVSLDPEHKEETPAESHQSSEVVELPAAKTTRRGRKPSADLEATSPERKPASRRVLKASASVDEEPQAAKKTAIRRGRKNEAHEDEEVKQIGMQNLPTEIVSATAVTSGYLLKAADEEELTPRRREGRNLPRKNYEEAPDDDKPHSGLRRARKPAASKALANKASESDSVTATPVSKQPFVKAEATPDNTVSLPEPTTSQRREGRNLPRKNYTEAPDDDKPTSARSRRVRNLTAKALELIVDTSLRPATPKRPKGKPVDVEEPPAKKATPEIPSTTETPGTKEEPLPATKGRSNRRKAEHSDLEEPDVKTAKKTVRGAGRKTKVETETETEEHPPIKKPRGGSRAKTPSEEAVVIQEEEPVKKLAARSRAKGAKAVEPEQAAEDSQVEVTSSKSAAPARGGRGRKVHFEAAPETAASETASSSQRATRSRRK